MAAGALWLRYPRFHVSVSDALYKLCHWQAAQLLARQPLSADDAANNTAGHARLYTRSRTPQAVASPVRTFRALPRAFVQWRDYDHPPLPPGFTTTLVGNPRPLPTFPSRRTALRGRRLGSNLRVSLQI